MVLYLVKSLCCLLLFLGAYHLFLIKEKMHQFNRWYLLGSILMAFVIPAFTITVEATKTTEMPITFQETEFISDISPVLEPQAQPIPYESYLLAIYLGISLMLLIYFCYNIYKLFVKINKSEKASYFEATVILLKEKVQPHSFLKYIFINKKVYKKDQQEQLILTHELAHVQQKHSIDIVLLELLNMLFWFVPIFKLYKKAIQLNHEFLADDAVIKTHKNVSEYQNLLLKLTTQNNNTYLASNLNYSLTKKRLLMMTTPSSKTKILLKKVLLFPVVAGCIFAFAQRVEAKQNEKPQVKEIKKLTTNDFFENRKNDPNYTGETNKKKPMVLFKETQAPVKTTTQPAGKAKQEKISFHKDWYITIDGQKYYYTFDKNERVARYYKKGKLVQLDIIKEYNKKHKVFEALKNSGKHYVFKTEEERKLIDQEFSDLGGMYFRMQQVDKSKVPYPKNPIGEYIKLERKDGSYYFKKRSELTNEDRKLLKVRMPPPAMDTIYTYKYFVEKIQAAPKTGKAYMIRIKQMYKEMTPKQRKQVIEPAKVLPPPPPIDLVFTYKKLTNKVQKSKIKSKENTIYLTELYNKMSASQKKQVLEPAKVLPPPPPPKKSVNEIAKK